MRSKALSLVITQLALALIVAMSGCGGGGGGQSLSTPETGVRALGSLGSSPALLATNGIAENPYIGATGEMNTHYPNRYQIPEAYSVAVSKFELLTDEDVSYTVFDTGSNLADAKVINLTSGTPAAFGENTQYPTPGTYTKVKMLLVYIEMTIKMDLNDGAGYANHKLRFYASSCGNVLNGDILIYHDNQWCWLTANDDSYELVYIPITESRPDDASGVVEEPDGGWSEAAAVLQDLHFSLDNDMTPDPYTETITLAEPMVVPADATGLYSVDVNFDVTRTPLIATSTGTFMWDDMINDSNPGGDGEFRPALPYAATGLTGDNGFGSPNGHPGFMPLPPTITVSYTK